MIGISKFQMAAYILAVGLLILTIVSLIYVYRLFKRIPKVKNPDGTISEPDLETKLEQVRFLKIFNKFNNEGLDYLLRVSRNPYHFTPTTFILIKYPCAILCVILALIVYACTTDPLYTGFLVLAGVLCFWYPTYYYKDLIKQRERSWNKIYSYIWRIDNDLETNDPKKMCIDMRDYLLDLGEIEMSQGFNYFYECWPENPERANQAIEEFAKEFPFQLPKDLFFVILETWKNATSASQRLENYRRTAILKYEKFSNNILSKVPSTATMYSLPFLLISVMIAILLPAVLDIMKALGGTGGGF